MAMMNEMHKYNVPAYTYPDPQGFDVSPLTPHGETQIAALDRLQYLAYLVCRDGLPDLPEGVGTLDSVFGAIRQVFGLPQRPKKYE